MIIEDKGAEIINEVLSKAGFRCWYVGGCLRDALRNQPPKDLDLATDATPEEYVAVFKTDNRTLRLIETGLSHGTCTVVVLDEPYEITSLRTETDHDGRWATMAYTRDLSEDLSRRDLTVNAMAMDFEGNIIDPFGGQADLAARRVRFVGNAEERMREDYLRILRYFRFHALIAGGAPLDKEATKAIRKTRDGLRKISPERIWMEMSKIVVGPSPDMAVSYMRDLGLHEIIGMPSGFAPAFGHAQRRGITNSASAMGWYVINASSIDQTATAWKWSGEERARAKFIAVNSRVNSLSDWKEMLVDGAPLDWVADLTALNGLGRNLLASWVAPKLPVGGADLIAAGMTPGPAMGDVLKTLERLWKDSDYKLTRDDLLKDLI